MPRPADRRARLDSLFMPASVAVVGVSTDASSPGAKTFHNLRRSFDGPVLGVNARGAVVDGYQTVKSVGGGDMVPELVVIATPSQAVQPVLQECGELGVRAAIVLSAGFAEAGDEGKEAQRRLAGVAEQYDMVMLGPNSMGLLGRPNGLLASFTNAANVANPGGRVAVVGQSGGMAAILHTILLSQGVGVDYLCALGNEASVSLGDAVEWFADPASGVDTVIGFVESLSGWPALERAAAAAERNGTVIALCRAGRSPSGASAASSHVGAVAGDDTVLTNLCQANGILQVRTMDDLVDIAKARHLARTVAGPRVGVVTASGGAGSLLADLVTAEGLELPCLSPELQRRVYEIIPWFGSAVNPVDTTAYVQNRPEALAEVVQLLCASAELDAVLLFLGTLDPIAERLVDALSQVASRHTAVPLIVAWGGGSRRFKTMLRDQGVATYDDPARAVRGLAGLHRRTLPAPPLGSVLPPSSSSAPRLDAFLPPELDRAVLGEHQVRALLAHFELPVVPGALVSTPDQAVKEATRIGGTVVLKLIASDLEHKSDVGAVVLGVQGEDMVRGRTEELLALGARLDVQVDGVLVEQHAPAGLELLCGFRRDPLAGVVVVVGLGGVLTEIVSQVAVRSAPLSEEQALDALRQLFDGRLLDHHRGIPASVLPQLVALLRALGEVGLRLPWLYELECNPVILSESGLAICDGLATATRPAKEVTA